MVQLMVCGALARGTTGNQRTLRSPTAPTDSSTRFRADPAIPSGPAKSDYPIAARSCCVCPRPCIFPAGAARWFPHGCSIGDCGPNLDEVHHDGFRVQLGRNPDHHYRVWSDVLGQAGVYLGRRGGLRPSGFGALRVLAIVTPVPLAGAGGTFAFPVIVFAPLAIIRPGWNRWLRLLLGVLALVAAVLVAFTLFSDLSAIRATIGVVWFALIYGILVWAVCFSFASRDDPRFTHGRA